MAYSIRVTDWTKINLDTARFLFHQAENMLTSTIETSSLMVNRAATMMQVLFVTVGADLGYLLTKVGGKCFYQEVDFQSLCLALIILSFAFYRTLEMYNLMTIASLGSEPKKLATDTLLFTNERHQELEVLLNEIEVYQDRIEHNLQENRIKAKQYRRIVQILYVGGIVVIAFTAISLLFRNL